MRRAHWISRVCAAFGATFCAALVALPAAGQPSDACRIACGAEQAAGPIALRACFARCAAGEAPAPPSPPPQAASRGRAAAAAGSPPRPATPPRTDPAAPAQPPASYGALYLAVPPRMHFGMAVGARDRLVAHQDAELSCRRQGGSCVLAQSFTEPCLAVVEGARRVKGVMFMTRDPSTYHVSVLTHAIANNPADAERQAIADCALRARGTLTCRLVLAACGPR